MSHILQAETRTGETGKGITRKLRATGRLPAVVYGGGEPATPISIDPVKLDEIFRKTRNANTIVTLDIEGTKVPTLVREAQRHPLKRDILHVDFYKVEADKAVQVMVPLTTTGKAKGAILGGRIRVVRRELPIRCAYDSIPEAIVVDITSLDLGEYMKSDELALPKGVELALDNPIVVIQCYGRSAAAKKADAAAAATAAAAAAAVAPAADAAPAEEA